jgi:AcrR family transcriptional regulator
MERSFHDVKAKPSEEPVSGKPQFDEAAVIAAAMGVFWRHGYAAASINDLTGATGLSRSSLYQRFRDKDGLFQEALAAYTERVMRRMNGAKAATARGRLEALLRAYLPDGSSRPPGCLIARSCAEISELSAEGRAAALEGARAEREILTELLREGIAAGELGEDADIDAMAWHYLAVLQAILNFPQTGADRSMIDRMIAVAMSAWPIATPRPAVGAPYR